METFDAALNSFKSMEKRLEGEFDIPTIEFLKFSIAECKKTMIESLRQCMWHLTWLMPAWKQETYAAVSAVGCRIISEVAKSTTPLLAYVPDLYVDGALEMVRYRHPTFFLNTSHKNQGIIFFCRPWAVEDQIKELG